MLNHTKKIKEIYENIQKKIYYMIPEKWDKMFLYCSIFDQNDTQRKTGELYFYYIPKGILKKKPVNVYEIPSKFNLDEEQYLKLVKDLYDSIKELREEFSKSERKELWTNLTISIQGLKFKIDFNYDDFSISNLSSYERHVIWRYEYLGIGPEQVGKEDREILKKHFLGAKTLVRTEHYDSGIYIQNIQNMVTYSINDYQENQEEIEETKNKNQILFTENETKKIKFQK